MIELIRITIIYTGIVVAIDWVTYCMVFLFQRVLLLELDSSFLATTLRELVCWNCFESVAIISIYTFSVLSCGIKWRGPIYIVQLDLQAKPFNLCQFHAELTGNENVWKI